MLLASTEVPSEIDIDLKRQMSPASVTSNNFQPSPHSAFHPVVASDRGSGKGSDRGASHQHSRSLSEPATMGSKNATPLQQLDSPTRDNLQPGTLDKPAISKLSHSDAEVLEKLEMEPRECSLTLQGFELGLSLGSDEKRGVVVVKSITRNSAAEKDGRIRVGDRIVAINGKSLESISLSKAR